MFRQGQQRRDGSETRVCPPLCPRPLGVTRLRPLCLGRGAGPHGPHLARGRTVVLLGPIEKASKSLCPGPVPLPQAASSAGSWPQPRTISARDFVPSTGHVQDQKSGAKILEAVQGLPCHLCPTTACSTAPVGSRPSTLCTRASAPAPRRASHCLDAPPSVCPTYPTLCRWRAQLSTCISKWLSSVREASDLLCDPNQVSGPLWALVSLPACWGQASNLRPIGLGGQWQARALWQLPLLLPRLLSAPRPASWAGPPHGAWPT